MKAFLVDTGPLVALMNRRDPNHAWSINQFAQLPRRLHTCESVLSEVCFLLHANPEAVGNVMAMVTNGALAVSFSLTAEAVSVAALMNRYANVPMSLADACLVRMTEMNPDSVIITLDTDFKIYRRNSRQVIPTIMPDNR